MSAVGHHPHTAVTPAVTGGAAGVGEWETDHGLLEQVLRPYKRRCLYVESAQVEVEAQGALTVRSRLSIPESWYIDDTGHLNAVEVNICYNQMMYFLVAKAVKEDLHPALAEWTLDDFWQRQLPDIVIARFAGNFRRPVDARRFTGELTIEKIERKTPGRGAPFLLATTSHRYRDEAGGRCDGTATLVLTNLPREAGRSRVAVGTGSAT
ncbi:(2E)-enoyl-ACP glycyltransferase [Streptomyces lonarensis]|uniref:(2E)-enoyl-ACP glycyltransferase n=1 Tax=Streptomyces lonarensis TaxID=700599 RepID=UPI0028A83309|nr:FcoT family thioesterase [Streptomyces lonarensis]